MEKVVIAVWRPDRALHRLVGDDVVIRPALVDQGRYGGGDPFDVLLTGTVDDPGGLELDSDDGRRAIGEDVRRFMAGPGPDTTLLALPRS